LEGDLSLLQPATSTAARVNDGPNRWERGIGAPVRQHGQVWLDEQGRLGRSPVTPGTYAEAVHR
jgi:hypothetical protein